MLLTRFIAGISSVVLLALGASVACGQAFPNKPIRILTGSPGGGSDAIARQIAQGISGPLGQQVIVMNYGGGRTADVLLQSPPDGYSISVNGNNTWTATLFRKLGYDAVRDFAPVTLVARDVNVVAVHPSLPVKSVKELIALAKARPGQLNFASSTFGSPQFMGTEIFKSMAGINIVGIPYKGVRPGLTALVSGEVQMIIADPGLVGPLAEAGKLKVLAVTSVAPTALAPGLPTVGASGLPGYEWVGLTGMFVPIKTPKNIIARLNEEIVRFLNRPEVKERFLSDGNEVVASTPEEFDAAIKTDRSKVAKVVKDAGIKLE